MPVPQIAQEPADGNCVFYFSQITPYHFVMRQITFAGLLITGQLFAAQLWADGPYPAFSGVAASADDAGVAGTNPAAMTLFDEREFRFELLGSYSESSWEGTLGNSGLTSTEDDSGSLVLPIGSMVTPLSDDWRFGFTVLGSGFSEEFEDDWVGRYFLQEYELLYISAFPSVATRLTDKLSVAGSLMLTHTTYDQRKAVPNIEPGIGDGTLIVETDGLSVGWGVSALYEFSPDTRLGFNFRSEIEPSLEGKAEFSNLGPITEGILNQAGLLNANIDVNSRQPASVNLGFYHDFENTHTLTVDGAWIDFSRYTLAEVFVNGNQIVENRQSFDDAIAFAGSYSWPVADGWRLGIGGFHVSDVIGDNNRTLTLRLDDIWSFGVGFRWQWRPDRTVNVTFNYLTLGDAPVETPDIPGIGQVSGRYTSRDTYYIRMSLSLGAGSSH
jgi:long-chain fatty acid transport protein